MGFRSGAYAKVWEVNPVSDTSTKLRISVSRKNKQSGEYEQDFSGYVMCIGTATAKKASLLSVGTRIKLGDTDVSTRYDAEKKMTYTNFKLFSFDNDSESEDHIPAEPQPSVDEGEPEDDHKLPF